jgi:hypothetical protein
MRHVLRLFVAPVVAIAIGVGRVATASPADADAASCVRLSGGRFDAPGNDNYAAYLNGEYVKFKNYCTTAQVLTGWRIHDYGKKHTYYIPSGFRIGAGVTVTLYSGKGTRTSTRLYWGQTYGAIWNNTPPERAYLRNGSGTLMSSWSSY